MKRKRYKSEKFKNSMFRNPQMKKFIGVQDQGFHIERYLRYSFGRSVGRVRLVVKSCYTENGASDPRPLKALTKGDLSTDVNYNREPL